MHDRSVSFVFTLKLWEYNKYLQIQLSYVFLEFTILRGKSEIKALLAVLRLDS